MIEVTEAHESPADAMTASARLVVPMRHLGGLLYVVTTRLRELLESA